MSAEHADEDDSRQPPGSLGTWPPVPVNTPALLTQYQLPTRAQRSVCCPSMTTTTTLVSIIVRLPSSSLWQTAESTWHRSKPRVAQLTLTELRSSLSPRSERLRIPNREEQALGRSRARTLTVPRAARAAHPPAHGPGKEDSHGHRARRQAGRRHREVAPAVGRA